jgi:hypothetical protein
MPAAKQLAALTTFSVTTKEGETVIVRKGEVLPANHIAVKGREELFAPFDPAKPAAESPVVEAATSGPGEQRA